MGEIKFEILEELAILSEKPSGWIKKLTVVKWGDHEPKYDIREWSPDSTKMGKGVTFNRNELMALKNALTPLTL